MSLQAGQTFRQYRIIEKIGEGGMGEVFLAEDTNLDRRVAIKVLPETFSRERARLERFEREAKAIASLSHPNVLAIHDFGREGETVYAAMELLEGSTLREAITHAGIPRSKAVDYARQIAGGLAAAHERGVVHRDLKPENLFLTRDGRVKILDFGLAKVIESDRGEQETLAATANQHTAPGLVLGTVGYMSPEQVRGGEADARSDIFSLGAVLYELLTGKRAFRGDSAVETLSAILNEDPPEMSSVSESLGPAMDAIVRHCLEKNPDERFQSARDLAFSLGSLHEVSSAFAAPAIDREPRRRHIPPGRAALLTVVALALGGLGTWALLRPEPALAPRFRSLTFRSGTVWSARFAPDGRTIVYGAAWGGQPLEVFSTQTGADGSLPLPFGPADLLSVSSRGELAISRGRAFTTGWETIGTLARTALDGGAPRSVLENVQDADWDPEGRELAVVREVGGRVRLEYPSGTVLHESSGWISSPRFHPRGGRIAFVDHPIRGDNVGRVAITDLAGNAEFLGEGGSQGIAWGPGGDELWTCRGGVILARSSAGEVRTVYSAPGTTYLLDVAPDGRVLLADGSNRREVVAKAPGENGERNLSWLDWTTLRALSDDGRTVFFGEGNRRGEYGYPVFIRGSDGSAPVRLGSGLGTALSPDGLWALSLRDPFGEALPTLLPTGAGEPRPLPLPDRFRSLPWAAWVPGREALLFAARENDGPPRLYYREIEGGEPRAVTPGGIRFSYEVATISPDGRWVATATEEAGPSIFSIDGETSRTVPGADPEDLPIQWTSDGRSLYVYRRGPIPTSIHLLDLETGERTFWRELRPAESSGVFNIDRVEVTRDGSAYAYSYRRLLSRLVLAEGLR